MTRTRKSRRWLVLATLIAAAAVFAATATAVPFTRGIEVDLAPARPHEA